MDRELNNNLNQPSPQPHIHLIVLFAVNAPMGRASDRYRSVAAP